MPVSDDTKPRAAAIRAHRDVALLAEAAVAAGKIAKGYFGRNPENWTKGTNSPVSEADIAVDRFLHGELLGARPDYGWLSEETPDTPERRQQATVFVVDPIDGTKAFLATEPDWTVSLAVVTDGRPVAAALYAPMHDELFLAGAGSGTVRNGEPVVVSARATLEGARLAGPHSLTKKPPFKTRGLDKGGVIRSLAYRLALVADGRLDAAVARRNACDWDLAAADLLIHEAGGRISDVTGTLIHYNGPTLEHPALAASGGSIHEALCEILHQTLA